MFKFLICVLLIFESIFYTYNAQTQKNAMYSDSICVLNASALNSYYNALKNISVKTPIHIVCIGDSHLQAGMLSDSLRIYLQKQYGNAGRGLIFPHALAKTNGSKDLKAYSTGALQKHIISEPHLNYTCKIGVSGYSVENVLKTGYVHLVTHFIYDSLKILGHGGITPVLTDTNHLRAKETFRKVVMVVKKGDTWSKITKRYKITKAEIIKQNPKYKSLKLKPGMRINIKVKTQSIGLKTECDSDSTLCLQLDPKAALHGLYFTNSRPGIQLSSIGVNGATMKKYLNHPEFFNALQELHPNLIVLWFGTNESYAKYSPEVYMNDLIQMTSKIKAFNSNVSILVITPPLSLLKKNKPNLVLTAYSERIQSLMIEHEYAVFPLYEFLKLKGGMPFLKDEQLIAKDNVHYTRKGYAYLAQLIYKGLQLIP
jgi:LysM repeat protein